MQFGQCLVEDATGKVGIDFDGAKVEAIGVVNEPTAAPNTATGLVGGVLSALSNSNARYQRKESILPADIPVYVIGEVQPGGLIGKHAKDSKNRLFVISHKSKDERTKSLSSTARWLLVISIVLFAVAAGLLVWGATTGPAKSALLNSILILRAAWKRAFPHGEERRRRVSNHEPSDHVIPSRRPLRGLLRMRSE